jgi:hypothetical protein
MSSTKLIINGKEAEVLQDTTFSFNYSIETTEPGKVNGAYSKRSITLPATKTNREIFEDIEQGEAVLNKANKILPARAEVGGLVVLSGKVQHQRTTLRGGYNKLLPSAYQIVFVGNNADWFSDIANLKIRDLSWGNLELTAANYDTYADTNASAHDVCFTLIKWAPWQVEGKVSYPELTPALFIASILRKAFEVIGYDLTSVFDSEPFSRLIHPLPLQYDPEYMKSFVNAAASLDTVTIPGDDPSGYEETTIIFDDDTTPPNQDGGNNYNTTTGEYTVPVSALYYVKIEFVSPLTLDPDNQSANIMVNGSAVGGGFVNASGVYIFEFIGELQAGDVITVLWVYSEQTIVPSPITNYTITDWQLTIEAEKNTWKLGETMEFDYLIPSELLVADLIKDLTRIFNLNWETDPLSRKVFAYPKDAFVATHRPGGTGALTNSEFDGFFKRDTETDITRKIDLDGNGEMELLSNTKQDYVLAWEVGDPTTEELERRNATSLYSARYRHADNRFEQGAEWNYTEYFVKTIHLNDQTITSSASDKAVQVPLLYGANYFENPEAEPDYTLAPRLLYFAGRRAGDDGYIRMFNPSTSATTDYDYPAAFMVNFSDPSGADFSLSYGDELTAYGATTRGLTKTLHVHNLRRIEEGRQYFMDVFWNELDINALTFRNALNVMGQRYILWRIDGYRPGINSPTKTYILLDVWPTVADLSKVASPVSLAGGAQTGLTSIGSINGVITKPLVGTQVIRYRRFEEKATTRYFTLPPSSGVYNVPDPYLSIEVNQNGKILVPELEWLLSGGTVEVKSDVHFDEANYYITVYDVINTAAFPPPSVRYRTLIEKATSRVITLPAEAQVALLADPYVSIKVIQNGKTLFPVFEWTIAGSVITIEEFTHFDECNYFITIHDNPA